MQTPIPKNDEVAQAEQRFRAAVVLGIAGDLRFLSHHDELRMLARTFVRARWPVTYSRGFNPLPQVVLPLPRSVGMASDCEWVLVDLNEGRSTEELRETLAAALPPGVTLREVTAPVSRVTLHARVVTYEVALTSADAERATPQIERLLAAGDVTIERQHGPNKPTSRIDIRPYIQDIVRDGQSLRMRVLVEQQSSARPSEILTALGLAAEQYTHHLRRSAVEWNIELTGPAERPVAPERKQVVHEENEPAQTSGEEDA